MKSTKRGGDRDADRSRHVGAAAHGFSVSILDFLEQGFHSIEVSSSLVCQGDVFRVLRLTTFDAKAIFKRTDRFAHCGL